MPFAESFAIWLQRTVWQRRVGSWEHEASPGLERVVAAVLAHADLGPEDEVLDLGCGSGQVTLPAAEHARGVLGVDISPRMVERLLERARAAGLANVTATASPLERLALPAGSVDVVVSNYVLHHLTDRSKVEVVQRARTWLRPGGRLVIGDMMLGRGQSPEERAIIATKVRAFAARGPAGYWRIAKNAVRYLLRVQEKPISRERWARILEDAGFAEVTVWPVVAEAAVIVGRIPAHDEQPGTRP